MLSSLFPRLDEEGYAETSPATARYNCIAWAAGATDAWWWPTPEAVHYWPQGAAREVTIAAFFQAFATLGFVAAEENVWRRDS